MLSLESLPAEIIDRLVPLLDLHSLFNLCHCLIYLKPLSKAIYDVSTTILMRNVWPRLELGPVYDNSCRPESYFDWFRSGDASLIQYTTILNRFGGALDLTLCCERHLHCYRQFLPRRFILTIQLSVTLPDQVEALLRILSLWKVDVEELSIFSDECQPDYDIEHLEKINLSAIQDMRVAKLNLFDVSPLLLEQVPQFKGVKTLQLDDADGFEHIAPIPSLECLIIENSDAKHQYNAQNAIIKGTHPNLKRVEVHYTNGKSRTFQIHSWLPRSYARRG
ncbi:hypothetical protein BJ741DRAFT_655442 [Chytriomyces cf. hyalinus JEL632]|nr:hypothetical protein BJ741DRAFT_655442 [Chytriomyces cf. hyalinus JEL632]